MPRVSVIVPNFNHARFLHARLRSVLGQTLADFELLILDDASTDDSLRIIDPYRSDPRVQVVVNQQNSGSPFQQWNKGLSLTAAELVWIAESDDIAEPTLLETLVAALEQHPSAQVAFAQSDLIDESDQYLGPYPDAFQEDFIIESTAFCRSSMLMNNTMPNASAIVFRRSALQASGGACTDFRLCGDWMTWVRLLSRPGQVIFKAAVLNHFRQHAKTVRATTSQLAFCRETLVIREWLSQQAFMSHAHDQSRLHSAMQADFWQALRQPTAPDWREAWQLAKKAAHWSLPLAMKLAARIPLAVLARWRSRAKG
jgi:glycosyltransferase involved in cell wall biosynthesis